MVPPPGDSRGVRRLCAGAGRVHRDPGAHDRLLGLRRVHHDEPHRRRAAPAGHPALRPRRPGLRHRARFGRHRQDVPAHGLGRQLHVRVLQRPGRAVRLPEHRATGAARRPRQRLARHGGRRRGRALPDLLGDLLEQRRRSRGLRPGGLHHGAADLDGAGLVRRAHRAAQRLAAVDAGLSLRPRRGLPPRIAAGVSGVLPAGLALARPAAARARPPAGLGRPGPVPGLDDLHHRRARAAGAPDPVRAGLCRPGVGGPAGRPAGSGALRRRPVRAPDHGDPRRGHARAGDQPDRPRQFPDSALGVAPRAVPGAESARTPGAAVVPVPVLLRVLHASSSRSCPTPAG